MKKRKFDELISHFNRKVADMDIGMDCKMELLGMVTALGCAHEKEIEERKTGKWNPDPINGVKPYGYICNLCGAWQPVERNYCPNCGADMRET